MDATQCNASWRSLSFPVFSPCCWSVAHILPWFVPCLRHPAFVACLCFFDEGCLLVSGEASSASTIAMCCCLFVFLWQVLLDGGQCCLEPVPAANGILMTCQLVLLLLLLPCIGMYWYPLYFPVSFLVAVFVACLWLVFLCWGVLVGQCWALSL